MKYFTYLTAYFGYAVTASLGIAAIVFQSAPLAYAAVLSMVVTFVREELSRWFDLKAVKNELPDEAKKRILALENRVIIIETGISRRGF